MLTFLIITSAHKKYILNPYIFLFLSVTMRIKNMDGEGGCKNTYKVCRVYKHPMKLLFRLLLIPILIYPSVHF